MGLFDFFDARKGIARWAARFFEAERKRSPHLDAAVIVQLALDARYRRPLHPKQQAIVDVRRAKAKSIHDLCRLVAEAELLHDLNFEGRLTPGAFENKLAAKTLSVIEAELSKLGFTSSRVG
jgi:hypothetical protein